MKPLSWMLFKGLDVALIIAVAALGAMYGSADRECQALQARVNELEGIIAAVQLQTAITGTRRKARSLSVMAGIIQATSGALTPTGFSF